jgi:hypothetical protein
VKLAFGRNREVMLLEARLKALVTILFNAAIARRRISGDAGEVIAADMTAKLTSLCTQLTYFSLFVGKPLGPVYYLTSDSFFKPGLEAITRDLLPTCQRELDEAIRIDRRLRELIR